mmetsp:Transcript_36810/g.49283  ORF Transcript_36810/g.49283 Transcript_36810/m.49283 type:complete len:88 (-) Transcript_36810:1753-2016(-)
MCGCFENCCFLIFCMFGVASLNAFHITSHTILYTAYSIMSKTKDNGGFFVSAMCTNQTSSRDTECNKNKIKEQSWARTYSMNLLIFD